MFSWQELYIGNSYADYNKILNALEENQIRTKTKITSTRDRIGRDLVTRGNPVVLNTAAASEEYRILVKKDQMEEAEHWMQEALR